MANSKKRVIKSLDNLSGDLLELLKRQYPNGYEESITRIATPKKEPMFVFPLETDDSVYLVKVPMTKNSDGGYDLDKGEEEEFSSSNESDDLGNDDSFSGSSDGDGDDYDNEGGGSSKSSGEASYDPDFDS